MKKIIQIISCIVLAGTLLCSCRKDEQPMPNPSPLPGLLVKKLMVSELDFQQFSYNSNKLLTNYTSQWKSSPQDISRIEYHYLYEAGKLIKQSNEAGHIEYKYSGNKLIEADNFLNNGRKLSTHQFSYDASGKLVAVTELITLPDQVEATRIMYEYYGDGNLQKMDFFSKEVGTGGYQLYSSKVFEDYDNHPQPIPNMILEHYIPDIWMQVNNPRKIRNLSSDGSSFSTVHMEYLYDDRGYPIKRNQHIEMNGTMYPVITYNYIY